ncbi:CoA-disulfide reductase [Enterococcus ratti]|uniref:Coenzyme A disulfide reductase n=1 Tax=Enterococcus ratti TaxID=150033 RepID=A0A1L8WCV0_9ENTE|nr:CoA-disulfide reductase [Enterococcus ratti]OJG78847.1 coenzyme A disulfide reductase [Enterococcus ratti]
MKIVVIGGIAAGMSAAAKAKRVNPKAEIIVFEQEDYISFGACGLPYYLGEEFSEEKEMFARTPEQIERSGIQLQLRHQVQSVDVAKKSLSVKNLVTNEIKHETYDRLMLAVGAKPFIPKVPGIDSVNVYTVTRLAQVKRLQENLPNIQNVVIIGGGFIGIEVADQLTKLGKNVHLLEMASELMSRSFDTEFTDKIKQAIEEEGVKVSLGETVTQIENDNGQVTAVKTTKGTYEADAVIVAAGFIPNTEFLNGQLELLKNGAIKIDTYGRTSQKDIFAAGDCASIPHRILGDTYLPLATTANKMGRIVGINISGIDTKEYVGALGSSAVKVGKYEAASTGITERAAVEKGIDVKTTCIETVNHSNYYGVQEKIMIKLVYDRQTKVLYGAQLFGKNETVLRATGLSVAIHAKMTTEELGFVDFAYAPPFASTWEALNVVANTAK